MNTKQKRIIRPMDIDAFPSELAKRRHRLGLTQLEMGQALGFHSTVLSQYEKEHRAIPFPQLLHMAVLALELIGADEVRAQLESKAR